MDARETADAYLRLVTVDRLDPSDHLRETLRLARDLCMGISAFYVDPSGWVQVEPPTSSANGTLTDRARELARSCLQHADARGDAPFWSAEPTIAGQMPDESLACVVVPLRHGDEFYGLVGVIDDWLPDLDDEQLLGLSKIAHDLAAELAARRLEAPRPEPAPPEHPPAPPHPATADVAAEAPTAQAAAGPVGAGSTFEDFLGDVADHLPRALAVVRDDGTVIFANQALTRLTGLAREELLGADVGSLLRLARTDEPAAPADLLDSGPAGLLLVSGPAGPVEVRVDASRIHHPLVGDAQVVMLAEPAAPSPSATPSDELLDALQEGIVLCDPRGAVVKANAEGHRLSGLASDAQLVGRPYVTQTRLRNAEGALFTPDDHPVLRALRGEEVPGERLVVDDPQGDRHHVVASARPFPVGGGTGALVTLRDVTLELREEARLNHLALHDALTGVANRYLLDEHLGRVLRAARARGGLTALIFMDLDNFKAVNDRYGHDAGDEVLAAVASRIQNAVRATELVARLGGDEFVVVCSKVRAADDVEIVVERLRKSLAAPYQVGGQAIGVTASIGWVVADRHVDTAETLLARADAEMYRAKRAARTRPAVVRT